MKPSRPATKPSPESLPAAHRAHDWLGIALVVALVVLAFANTLGNGFNYDDDGNILENQDFRGLGPKQLGWMFTTFHLGHYQPLSWLTLALDYTVWGLNPLGYHLTNLLLHVGNAVLVFLLARRFLPPAPAALATLLWAVHPLRVESVAWITERRDVQSSFFLLLTVVLYLRAHAGTSESRRRLLIAALAAYLLSLLSRAMGVTLPVILLLLDWWPLRRIGGERGWLAADARHVYGEKLLFCLPAAVFAALAPLAQAASKAAMTLEELTLRERFAQAGYGLVFYLWKTLWPLGLAPLYELREPLPLLTAKYLLPAALLAAAVIALALLGRRRPWLVVVAATYAVLLAPVLGFVQSGRQEVADRYSYLPLIGWTLLAVAGVQQLRFNPRLSHAALAVAVATLGGLTWQQNGIWRDYETLWTHSARHAPGPTAHQNLAVICARSGRLDAAIEQYRAALAIEPLHEAALKGLAWTYAQARRFAEAVPVYETLVRHFHNDPKPRLQYAHALREVGRADDALREYAEVTRLDPSGVEARMNAGLLLRDLGRPAPAADVFRDAVRVRPDLADARVFLAEMCLQLGQRDDAIRELREVLRQKPDHADARRLLEAAQRPTEPRW